MNIEEIKKRHAVEIMFLPVAERYSQCRNDVEYLLSLIEQAEEALNLAIKHISGKAEIFSEREKTPVLYQLNECLKSIQGEG